MNGGRGFLCDFLCARGLVFGLGEVLTVIPIKEIFFLCMVVCMKGSMFLYGFAIEMCVCV